VHDFRKLDVWRLGMNLATETYEATCGYPADERFGLQSQMRRAAVSVPSNIAEGSSKSSEADFRRFLIIAKGSASELETQVLLSEKLGYLEAPVSTGLCQTVRRCQAMLTRLIMTLS
jgi:four helix bundle protein